MLQKQSAYGLAKSGGAASGDIATKGRHSRKSSGRVGSSRENPFAPRDPNVDAYGPTATSHQQALGGTKQRTSQQQRFAKQSKSPSFHNAKSKSPGTSSMKSSGSKQTPCISAISQSRRLISNQTSNNVSAEKNQQMSGFKSAARYQIDQNLIAEEENDGSSYLLEERSHNQVLNSATDDNHSQLSQNLMGAHLVKDRDMYPFQCSGSVFQTPKPDRDTETGGKTTLSNTISPMTEYAYHQYSSNAQPRRLDYNRHSAQMIAQKTPVTNYKAYDYRAIVHEDSPSVCKENPTLNESNFSSLQQQSMKKSSAKKRNRYDNSQSTVVEQLSGLALNVRKQTSPEANDKSLNNAATQVGSNGAYMLTVQATQVANAESSYDHSNATRLIDDYSPESQNRILNVYQGSADRSANRFSSMRKQLQSTSPANIKLEPVRVGNTSAFEDQRIRDQSPKHHQHQRQSSSSPTKKQSSPVKRSSQSPLKKSPVKKPEILTADLQINTITEESPETGNPLVAQKIYENLKRLEYEQEDQYDTVSASDISIAGISDRQRPKSSNEKGGRRSRRDRKTPSGRSTVNALLQQAKKEGNTGRAKYGGAATHQKEERTRSSSNTNLKRSSTPSNAAQAQPQSQAEQTRLANLAKARKYGNRASQDNKSNISRPASRSPCKKNNITATPKVTSQFSEDESPRQPEILSTTNLSTYIQHPKDLSEEKSYVSHSRNTSSKSVGRKLSNNSSLKRQKTKMKLSQAAKEAKANFMQKHHCAKKIQQTFRVYLTRQMQIEKKLAHDAQMGHFNGCAARIQRCFKAYVSRMSFYQAIQQRHRLKMIVNDLGVAWKTRRSLNCLGSEVQEFVNCENEAQRLILRRQFHQLYDKVIEKKLFLEVNFDKLQKIKTQMQAAAAKKNKNQSGPQNCAKRAKERTQQHVSQSGGSPFKKTISASPPKEYPQSKSPLRQSPVKQFRIFPVAAGCGGGESGRGSEKKPLVSRPSHQQQSYSSVPREQRSFAEYNSRQQRQSSVKNTKQSGAHNRHSTGSIRSRDNNPVFEQSRQSIDIDDQAINELKNFIQNSGAKNESYCSIKMTNQLGGAGGAGGTGDRQRSNQRERSNGKSQVQIKVHNGSVNDQVLSPPNEFSDAKPLNLVIDGSCTRFSRDGFVSNNQRDHGNNPAATVPNSTSQKKQTQPQPQPQPQHSQEVINKTTVVNRFEQRKSSQEGSGGEYRSNLKKVKSRVDCWNRSATREQTTPKPTAASSQRNENIATGFLNQQPQQQQQQQQDVEEESGSEAKLQTPILQFRNVNRLNASSSKNLTNNGGNHNNSFNIATTTRSHQQQALNQPGIIKQAPVMNHRKTISAAQLAQSQQSGADQQRSRSYTNVGLKKQSSLLKEPTRFPAEAGAKRVGPSTGVAEGRRLSNNHTTGAQTPSLDVYRGPVTPAQAVSRSLISHRPKSSGHMTQAASAHQKPVAQMMMMAQVRAERPTQMTRADRQTAKNNEVKKQLNTSANTKQQHHGHSASISIFQMRETLVNLTQAMEQIAAEADTNQRQIQTDVNMGRSGFGMNSQHRATIKNLQIEEKAFNGMIDALQRQFGHYKTMAMPGTMSQQQNQDLQ